MQKTPFRAALERLAPVFAVLTAAVYVYVWVQYPTFTTFMDHLFPYQAPVLVAHGALAYLTAGTQHRPSWVRPGDSDCDDSEDWPDVALPSTGTSMEDSKDVSDVSPWPDVNVNGLPMMDTGLDIHGNSYGMDLND